MSPGAPLFQKKESEIPFEFRGSNFFCQQPGYRMGGIEPEKGPMDARIADLTKLVSELKLLSEFFYSVLNIFFHQPGNLPAILGNGPGDTK
jgi:hypothetical protein